MNIIVEFVMKKKLLFCFIFIFAIFLPYITYDLIPFALNSINHKKTYLSAELTVSKVNVGNDVFEYAEGGKGDTVVLIHGFQSDKKAMIPFAKALMRNYRVILPDLSGHGGSSAHENQHYDIRSLSKDLGRFIDKMNLKNMHLIGTSTGGGVSICYYLDHPYAVKTISLINPLGVNTPINSEFQNYLKRGRNLLLPSTLKELDDFAIALIGKPFAISNYLKEYFLKALLKKRDFFQSVFDELIASKPLDKDLGSIKIPVLIIGSQDDKILHASSYEVFHKNIVQSKYVLLEAGTHVLIGNAVEKANVLLKDFLSDPESVVKSN
jgi:abhydrolase domain-containing protein 6